MFNIKQFIFIFLAIVSSAIIYGGGYDSDQEVYCDIYADCPYEIYKAIGNRTFFPLTPGKTDKYSDQKNARWMPPRRFGYWGNTPLDHAILMYCPHEAKWLVDHGADIGDSESLFRIVLEKSISLHNQDISFLKLILERGGYSQIDGRTPVAHVRRRLTEIHEANIGTKAASRTLPEGNMQQAHQIALLQSFERFSPARAAWMGAVYKGCLVRDGRVAGAGTPVLSSKCVKLVE